MAENTASPTPEVPQTNQIGIGAQYIKDLSFECPGAPHIFAPTQTPATLDVGVNVQSRPVADNAFEVALMIKLESKIDTKIAYIAELSYAGVFVIPKMPDEALKLFLMVEAPRILFPFARAIMANTVREGGFQPVMLTPIDFMGLYQANKNQLGVVTPAGAA